MLRKIFLVLGILLMLFPVGVSEERQYFSWRQEVYTAEEGGQAVLDAGRRCTGGKMVLVVTDDRENEIIRRKIEPGFQGGNFYVTVEGMAPSFETYYLYAEINGEKFFQDECQVAIGRDEPAITRVDTREKKMAITFDTAGGEGKTVELLNLLDDLDVQCTFFVQGEFAVNHPEILAKMVEKGHELGNHSTHHPQYPKADNTRIAKELNRCSFLLSGMQNGKPVALSRPPSGYTTFRDRCISRAMGMEVVNWTVDTRDGFPQASWDRVWSRLTGHQSGGTIFLMHVYGKHTWSVLKQYIPMMQEKGYEFVTVSELLYADGWIDENGVQHPN